MAQESTASVSETIELTANNTQDSLLIQLVKQENENGALAPHPDPAIEMKVEQDTIMTEATPICNETSVKNDSAVKIEAVERTAAVAAAQKDDTPVEPSLPSSSLLSSDVSVEPQQQPPSVQQQQQQQSTQPQQSTAQPEQPSPLITPDTASMSNTTTTTPASNTTPANSVSVNATPSDSVPGPVATKTENTATNVPATQHADSLPASTGQPMQIANVQATQMPVSVHAQNATSQTTATTTPTTATLSTPITQAATTQSTIPTPAQTTQPPQSQAATDATPPTTTTATVSLSVATPPTPAPAPTPITTFEEIQKQLKNTLDHVEQRNMVSGFQTLSKATGAVVDHCEQLGLTSDDHPYNAIDREQFWAGLNNCWLYALAQRQEPSSDAERLTDQHLYSLREMVVSWADKLERFGLVDYEMGWWEADILAAIDGILAMNYAAAQAAAQAVVAQAAAALFGEDVNM
ncbi:hypothetical protein MAM1_0031d02415 [Mucor ambiguus]|uniref:Uncharacterized protein n=1 Tax=Mucor ambiguus TaxID=91626 RepID=A0A0C9LSM5_9FUNG|nr:hypothetical protein MAM1_0031d02415 [Mucor ambiguus]